MKNILITWCVALSFSIAFHSSASAQKSVILTSPSGELRFSMQLKKGSVLYNVNYKSKPVINESRLGLAFADGYFGNKIRIGKAVYRDATESYELPVGKAGKVDHQYRELVVPLEEAGRVINFVVRAFDDGIAFRYEFLRSGPDTAMVLTDEHTAFNVNGNPKLHALFLPGYTTSHEGYYTSTQLSTVKNDTLMDMPALLELPGDIFLAITEAALVDYAGMYLSKQEGILTSKLSPLPGQNGVKVKASLPHKSPWRVLMISDRIGDLVESNILTSLNEPCKINDLGWIKPGKTTFPWWNGNVVPDTLIAPGNNFVTAQYYIDFCARNNIEYHSVVEYGLHQWYVDDGINFQPGPNADVTKPVPGLDMKEICDYAATKGVGVRVWVHWAALYPKLDTAFALFEKWGLKGMMVDFMDRDDQEMVNIQNEMLEKAAKHRLHIQFHGAYKPTGLHRTWPNEFTREGALNYEANKWSEGLFPDHDIMIPFTRMLAGSTDYHLGGFRAVTPANYKTQYTKPLMRSTRCHMLAMYVVLENYLPMVGDFPAAYEGEPGFEFITDLPGTWDETKVIDAKVGEYIIVARRKDTDWWLGAITNNDGREISVNFNFLTSAEYTAIMYTDGSDIKQNPNQLNRQTKNITRDDVVKLNLAAGGGAVMQIMRKR